MPATVLTAFGGALAGGALGCAFAGLMGWPWTGLVVGALIGAVLGLIA